MDSLNLHQAAETRAILIEKFLLKTADHGRFGGASMFRITTWLLAFVCLFWSAPLDAQDKEKRCEKYFSVQWVDPQAKRTEGMITVQLKWWDENHAKKFPGVCYDERGDHSQYVIVMSDSRAGYEYTTLVPIQQTATTSGGDSDEGDQHSAVMPINVPG
jgi:hypothetical protein